MSLRRLFLQHKRTAKWPFILVILACAVLWKALSSRYEEELQPRLDGAAGKVKNDAVASKHWQPLEDLAELPACTSVLIKSRLDCHPDEGVTEERCRKRGCCWDASSARNAPPCYMPDGYTAFELSSRQTTAGLEVMLQRIYPSGISGSTMQLKVLVYHYYDDVVRIKIRRTYNEEYEPLVPPISNAAHLIFTKNPSITIDKGTLIVNAAPDRGSFVFHLGSFICSTKVNQIKVQVPATMVYGLQSKHGSYFAKFTERSAHSFYSFDDDSAHGKENESLSFGGHPFLPLLDADTSTASGIFLWTSNSIVMTLAEDKSLTFKTDGGTMDFFLFLAPTLKEVVRDYQRVVGFPAMPPQFLFNIKNDKDVYQNPDTYFLYKSLPLGDIVRVTDAGEPFVLACNGEKVTCKTKSGFDDHWCVDFSSPDAGPLLLSILSNSRLMDKYFGSILLAENIGDYADPCCTNITAEGHCPKNAHNLSNFRNLRHAYPYYQARLTYEAFTNAWKIRRALLWHKSFPGQGRFSGYWNSVAGKVWEDLTTTLGEFLLYNMYGMPIYGTKSWCSDANSTADQENLCIKWLILATFFPVYMNTSSATAAVYNSSRYTFFSHNCLRPYSYTLYYKNSRFGDMVARPMVFEFQNDTKAREVERQFMFGSALLVAPIQEYGANITAVYFPRGLWYDWYNGKPFTSNGEIIYVPVNDVYRMVYQRAGTIVAMEAPSNDSSTRNILLAVAPSMNESASGEMYVDDGIRTDAISRERYSMFRFSFLKNQLTGRCSPCNHPSRDRLTSVTVLSMKSLPDTVLFNGNPVSKKHVRTTMYVRGYSHPMIQPFQINW
ncbi:lysosomal alpha-glucosidase-like [Ornithodoros turicata]|uniref:lysosomal alpha-glucosidase-like n=1 Tax=Ornithodoros turicata TaxID=34597 RepID=UPI003138E27E